MYKVTDELSNTGFSINPMNLIIKRNHGSLTFNTQDFFCVFIVIQDSVFIIDKKEYKAKRGSLVFVRPSQNITFGQEFENPDQVYVVAFSAAFYERCNNDSILLNSDLFFDYESEILITMATIPIEEVQKLIINRLSLYKDKNNEGLYISIAHNCVEALLLEGLYYVNEEVYEKHNLKKFTSFDMVNRFRVLLQKHYKKERQVGYYADALHVTPRRLSDMTEKILGKRAKEFIIDKTVSESIRMLRHSQHTISEIAYELNFSDEGNFSTFIKKHTERSPSEIRSL